MEKFDKVIDFDPERIRGGIIKGIAAYDKKRAEVEKAYLACISDVTKKRDRLNENIRSLDINIEEISSKIHDIKERYAMCVAEGNDELAAKLKAHYEELSDERDGAQRERKIFYDTLHNSKFLPEEDMYQCFITKYDEAEQFRKKELEKHSERRKRIEETIQIYEALQEKLTGGNGQKSAFSVWNERYEKFIEDHDRK